MPGDEPIQHDTPNNLTGLSKSVSQTNSITSSKTTTSIPSDAHQKKSSHQITPSEKTNDTALYAVPQRIEHKSDLKATLVEKYCEPQYQNIPNDMLLKRKNSVDANTMTSWTQNGLPVSGFL